MQAKPNHTQIRPLSFLTKIMGYAHMKQARPKHTLIPRLAPWSLTQVFIT